MKGTLKFTVMALVLCICAHNAVFAQEGKVTDTITWKLSGGTLTLSGKGEIPWYNNTDLTGFDTKFPWKDHVDKVTKVVIGDGIIKINSGVFYRHKNLTSATLGKGLVEVSGFAGTGLTEVVIPDNVKVLGSGAFHDCVSLASVKLGNGLTEISNSVFNGCTSITTITIPESITKVGMSCFSGCQKLATLYFNAENCEDTPNLALFSANGPFSDCRLLKTVVIGDNVLNVPSLMFSGIKSLTTLTIGKKVTRIGTKAFEGCTNITSTVVIPDSVRTINADAFKNCGATTIVMGKGIREIGREAFTGSNITEITIPENVTSIGNGAFDNCAQLRTVYWNAIQCSGSASSGSSNYFSKCPQLTTLVIGDSVNVIPHSAFFSMKSSLTTVTIGSNVTRIGGSAFWGCNKLTKIVIPDSVQYIGGEAFAGCASVTSLTLGNGLSEIEARAFTGLRIRELTVPEGVSGMSRNAFSDLSRLETVYWNASNCTVGDFGSFDNCNNITTIVFGDSVRTIPAYIANNLKSLETVTFGSRVNSIGGSAFRNCTALEEITVRANKPPTFGSAFDSIDKKFCTLRVPAASVNTYRTADNWKDFPNITAIP